MRTDTADPASTRRPAIGPRAGPPRPPVDGAAGARPVSPEDAAIIDAARRGDRGAWGCLYRRYARVVHGVLISRVAARDAEDLVQDVFARAIRSIGALRDDASMGAWLAAVARNRATDFLRERRRRGVEPLDEAAAPDEPVGALLEAGDVLAAMRKLPDAYRETLALRLVEGLTGPEIADRLGMTHGSVRVNLSRGMTKLREALGMEDAP